ncbi:hypothetical protein QL285_033589 [Trifolium repens]|nr:hypothetical protein QL285_033589 [Trifolium repens]
MVGNNNFHANLPILDGKNWDMWVKQMRVIFTFQEVYEQVNANIAPLPANANEEQRTTFKDAKKKDNNALFLIHQYVDAKVFEKIADVVYNIQRSVGYLAEELWRRCKGEESQIASLEESIRTAADEE